ncbi:MAG TPA: redoxin domain-containing protein [Aggregatilineales bacterium]|nr:hypothetical protein [Anaerolineales bacterium]HRE47683.1 redoxin domain-containing protein [Aggregatilineales bacterium]
MPDRRTTLQRTPLPFGKLSPNFNLESVGDGLHYTREGFRGKAGLLIIFFSDPAAVYDLLSAVGRDSAEYAELNARVFALSPADRESLLSLAADLPFPILRDAEGKAWTAFTGAGEYAYAVFSLDTYGGVEGQRVVATAAELPNAKELLYWVQGAQFKCSI